MHAATTSYVLKAALEFSNLLKASDKSSRDNKTKLKILKKNAPCMVGEFNRSFNQLTMSLLKSFRQSQYARLADLDSEKHLFRYSITPSLEFFQNGKTQNKRKQQNGQTSN